ncbi:acyl-CoA thioesterase [Loktanella sp. F6476L]|uniref:acyl-CoA thioesterase n=1 Tax=Loktanella sp. F6476L TaxID=2926405 RepID=UPI001FF3DEFC|nr:thioesterase family protein [Loktanella sp. F6476L]MCK0119807.1 acyl-CoA thioesterase [Loktanella sp. F6476L]
MTAPFLTPLLSDDLRSLGIPEPWSYGMADRVRFGEIDALGHVNNVVYLRWYETLRVNYLKDYGVYDLAGPDPKIVVKTVGLDFKAEVKADDGYINLARTVEMRNTSFTMQYATLVNGQITTTGHAVVVLLNADNTKRALPDALRATFAARDGVLQI